MFRPVGTKLILEGGGGVGASHTIKLSKTRDSALDRDKKSNGQEPVSKPLFCGISVIRISLVNMSFL